MVQLIVTVSAQILLFDIIMPSLRGLTASKLRFFVHLHRKLNDTVTFLQFILYAPKSYF
jgi:hypothetical protein